MGGIRATQDNSVAISSVYEQEALEGDFVDNTPSIDYKLPEIALENDSTSTAIKSFDVPTQGDEVRLYNGTDGVVSGSLGTTSSTTTREEFIINGTFNTDMNNWSEVGTAWSYDSTDKRMEIAINQGGQYFGQYVTVPQANVSYTVKASIWSGSSTNAYIMIGTTLGGKEIARSSAFSAYAGQDGSVTFTPTSTSFYVTFGQGGNQQYVYIDNVRLFRTSVGGLSKVLYTSDITSLGLTNPPTKAWLDKPITVSTCTEANEARCIAQDETLDFVSSTLTEYVGTNAKSGLITTGDVIQLDGASEVVTSNVVESPAGTYTCTIPTQASAPTSAKVLDRSITTTVASDVYDNVNDKFVKTYNKIEQQGRSFKYKIEADSGVEVTKVAIPLNREQ